MFSPIWVSFRSEVTVDVVVATPVLFAGRAGARCAGTAA